MNLYADLSSVLESPHHVSFLQHQAQYLADLIYTTKSQNKLILIFGNGGSAADAQHFAAELVCTYRDRSRPPYPAIALTTDSSVLTAWSNDFDYSDVFARQLAALSSQVGLAIGLSTSGSSQNVLNAISYSSLLPVKSVLITGFNSREVDISNCHHIKLPSVDTPIIQTLTQMLYHDVCQHLDKM